MTSIFRLLLFRVGPQDVPYSPQLMRGLVPLAALVSWFLFSMMLPVLVAAVMAIVNVLGVVLVAEGILRSRNMSERVPQTVTALLGTGIVLNLLMLYPASVLAPHIAEIAKKLQDNPKLLQSGAVKLPQGPVLVIDALNIWGFAVTAYVYKHAANVRVFGGIGLAVVASLVVLMLVLMAATFISVL